MSDEDVDEGKNETKGERGEKVMGEVGRGSPVQHASALAKGSFKG